MKKKNQIPYKIKYKIFKYTKYYKKSDREKLDNLKNNL
jgi:hypothetical protein